MNAKNIINTLVMLAMAGLVAWQGPGVASLVVAAVIAVGALVAALHIIPPKAVEYIEDLEDALQKNAPDAAKKVVKSDGGPKGGAIATLLVLIGISCCVIANTNACNPTVQQQAVNTIQPAAACVVDVVTAINGNVDIADIIKECGVTLEDIIAIVSALLDHQPDAGGALVSDAAVGAHLSSDQVVHLRTVLENAEHAKSAKLVK